MHTQDTLTFVSDDVHNSSMSQSNGSYTYVGDDFRNSTMFSQDSTIYVGDNFDYSNLFANGGHNGLTVRGEIEDSNIDVWSGYLGVNADDVGDSSFHVGPNASMYLSAGAIDDTDFYLDAHASVTISVHAGDEGFSFGLG